ncbi:MAG: glutathione S-transferase family protein [Pikeienuella sp.]
MILYGRNMSPFARRIAIWARLQGRALERREIRPLGETWDEIRAHNPVGRVPVLILDDGTRLIETFAICDWLEQTAPQARRLIPSSGPDRLACLQRIAIANATTEKIVELEYEVNRRPAEYQWPDWRTRLVTQVQGGLAAMEAAAPQDRFHGGEEPDGSDIVQVVALQMAEVTNPWVIEPATPRLSALAERAMTLPAFAETKPAG